MSRISCCCRLGIPGATPSRRSLAQVWHAQKKGRDKPAIGSSRPISGITLHENRYSNRFSND